jgi:phage pi2 protein 07
MWFMSNLMTITEIEAQFASEWVLVENPQTNQALEVQGGIVRYHSKDRDEVYRQAIALRPQRFAVLYTGRMPEDTAIVL